MVLAVEFIDIAVDRELPVPGGELGARHALDQRLGPAAVGDDVREREHGQVMLPGELPQLGRAHHGAVLAHDLAAQAAFREPRKAAQVDRRFGVAGAL